MKTKGGCQKSWRGRDAFCASVLLRCLIKILRRVFLIGSMREDASIMLDPRTLLAHVILLLIKWYTYVYIYRSTLRMKIKLQVNCISRASRMLQKRSTFSFTPKINCPNVTFHFLCFLFDKFVRLNSVV